MAFKSVYESLKELFPQIDARALKAVAIEHSKDVDAAVVAVLEEIVPFFTGKSIPNSPFSQCGYGGESSEGSSSVRTDVLTQLQNDYSLVSGNRQPSSCSDDGPSEPFYDLYAGNHDLDDKAAVMTTLSVETHEDRMQMNANVHSQGESLVVIGENMVEETHHLEVSVDPQREDAVTADEYAESRTKTQPAVRMLQDVEMGIGQKMDCIQEKEDADGTAHDISASTSRSSAQLVKVPDIDGTNLDKSNLTLSTDTTSNVKNMSNTFAAEDDSTSNAAMSSQICIIDVMEEMIEDARKNKKILFLEMESVINLMKQVEVKEQAAEQAKTEAATASMDLQNQVEELKGMLQRAKEANNMNAGEVYGEKAILATELRELQSRVHSLSDERDKSLADLDEMRQSLEVRLASAINEIKSTELKKLEKEEVAQKSLAEQKLIMEEVVRESKILRQQAEDNAKLQEFLVDRGRVVDTLQGEIAVICQDVKLLKEKFDQHVPLGKSLFSSHTSFILASSSTSLKSVVPDQVETVTVRDDQLETESNREDCKAPDDGWEFFESSEANT